MRISIYRREKFKLWRELEVPSRGNTVLVRVRDAGNRVSITVNEFTIEMPPLIPIFTDFYLHLQKSAWVEFEEIEVRYF